jgi:MoaA/NifB/PqqE/SkfB family radical SAM enzyme
MTLLDEYKLKKLFSYGVDELTVSLDGVGEIHDLIRGFNGCFNKVIDNIKLANHYGIHIDIVSVISSINMNYLEPIINTSINLSCSSLTFSGIISKTDKLIDKNIFLDDIQKIKVLDDIEYLRSKYCNKIPIRTVGFSSGSRYLCNKNNIVSISSSGWIERCLLSNSRTHRKNICDIEFDESFFDTTELDYSLCYF